MTLSSFVRFHHPILCVTCQASPITVEKFQTRKQEARDVPFQLSDWWNSLLKPHHFSLARRRRRIIPHSSCCKGRKPTTTTQAEDDESDSIRFAFTLVERRGLQSVATLDIAVLAFDNSTGYVFANPQMWRESFSPKAGKSFSVTHSTQ